MSELFCRSCGGKVHPDAIACVSCGRAPLAGTDYCQNCGAESDSRSLHCYRCGSVLRRASVRPFGIELGDEVIAPPPTPINPLLAGLASLIVPWVGQILLGQKTKGIILLLVTLALASTGIGLLLWPISAIDGFLIARRLKNGQSVRMWDFF